MVFVAHLVYGSTPTIILWEEMGLGFQRPRLGFKGQRSGGWESMMSVRVLAEIEVQTCVVPLVLHDNPVDIRSFPSCLKELIFFTALL